MSIGSSACANSMPPNPAPLNNAPHPAGAAEGECSRRPTHLAQAEYGRGLGEPGAKDGVLLAGAPAKDRQPAAVVQRLPQVGERRRRVIEEHDTETAQQHVEGTGPERVHLSVGDLEPDVSDAGSSGEPPRFGDLDP
jgi:hypothetical protein